MNSYFEKKPDIIIVDDHLIFRQGLKAIINYEEVGSVIAEASNGEEFIQFLSTLKPDLVLLDIDMPQMNGFEAAQKALDILPDLKIIAFTVFSEEEYYLKMMNIGAKGFLLKSSGITELENAIQLVMKGENYFSNTAQPENSNAIATDIQKDSTLHTVERTKTKREMLFFPWIANKGNFVNI
jgi:DNA-binding NarL/FixJ family response regulator